MNCPDCCSACPTRLQRIAGLGYAMFCSKDCHRSFNERTGYPRASEEKLGEAVEHEFRDCRGNPIEQSHRGIKQRCYPMLGFGAFESAQRFCQAYDEARNFLRPQRYMTEVVSLSEKRERFIERVNKLQVIFQAANTAVLVWVNHKSL